MKFNHTPGPWAVKHSESKDAYNVIGTAVGLKYKIARCPYYKMDHPGVNKMLKEEAFANAKLVAYSPQILKELIDSTHAMEMLISGGGTIQLLKEQIAINRLLILNTITK